MAEKEKGGVRLDVPAPDGDGSDPGVRLDVSDPDGDGDETEELGMRSRYHNIDIIACFKLVVKCQRRRKSTTSLRSGKDDETSARTGGL